MQAVILAAGLGTRLRPFTYETPKPLMPVNGKPFIWYLLKYLQTQKIKEVVICTAYRTDEIFNYIRDGSDFGLRARYSKETGEVKGTFYTLKHAEPVLDDVFVVINGDTYMKLDYQDADAEFFISKKKAMMVTFDAPASINMIGNVEAADDNIVQYKKEGNLPQIDAGVLFLKKSVLSQYSKDITGSIEDVILQPLIKDGQVAVYRSGQRFWDIGTPERWKEFEKHIKESEF